MLEHKMAHLSHSLLSREQLLNVHHRNKCQHRPAPSSVHPSQSHCSALKKRRRRKATWRGRGASAAGHGNVYVYSGEREGRMNCCPSAPRFVRPVLGEPASSHVFPVTIETQEYQFFFHGASLRTPAGCPKMCQMCAKKPLPKRGRKGGTLRREKEVSWSLPQC